MRDNQNLKILNGGGHFISSQAELRMSSVQHNMCSCSKDKQSILLGTSSITESIFI